MERMTHSTETPSFREKLFSQEPRLIEAANRLANVIRTIPHDARYPDVQPRSLIVGGFVRDAIRGGHPKDIDMEIYGVAPERLESLLNQLYPGLVNTVGQSYRVLKIHLGDDVEFDVSIPRRDSKVGQGHKDFIVEGDPAMSIKDAARRRDFTINALAADALTGEIIDEFGGLKDLEEKRLRVTDPERFQDDPLRVYRALQFAARMNLTVDPESRHLMREMVARGDLKHLSRERVTEEFKKLLLKSEKPSVGFELARNLGVIKREFPEMDAMIGCPQEAEWHPEGDVWIHTMMVIDQAAKLAHDPQRNFSSSEQLELMLGALCHDLGKPRTTKTIDGRIRSLGHDTAGERPTRHLCARLHFPKTTVHAAIAVAREHLRPSEFRRNLEKGIMNERSYANAVRKTLKRIHPVSWRVFIAACEADARGRAVPGCDTAPYLAGELFAETITKNHLDIEPTKPLLLGRDVIDLGVKPGPEVGDVIKKVEDLRDTGKITTAEEAIEAAKKLLND